MYLLKVYGLVDGKVKVVEQIKFVKYAEAFDTAKAFAICGELVQLCKNVEQPIVFAN